MLNVDSSAAFQKAYAIADVLVSPGQLVVVPNPTLFLFKVSS